MKIALLKNLKKWIERWSLTTIGMTMTGILLGHMHEYESGPPWRKSMVNSYIWKKEDKTKADNGKRGKTESIPTLKC